MSGIIQAIAGYPTVGTTTLYSQTTQNNYSNWNWNEANDNYAWQFTATSTGVPGQITFDLETISGTPTGEIYIKSDKTFASTTYGSATGITFTSGTNTITLTGGSSITSGNSYWIYFKRTSSSTNSPSFRYDTTKTNFGIWRSNAINIDPNTLWQTYDIKMTITT